jgi:hypothetical protein
VKRESARRVSKWVPCAENFKERAGTIKRTKKHSDLGQAAM